MFYNFCKKMQPEAHVPPWQHLRLQLVGSGGLPTFQTQTVILRPADGQRSCSWRL